MNSSGDVGLAILGTPLNLVALLRKEIKLEGIKISSKEDEKSNYKIVVIDPTDPNLNQQNLDSEISTNSKNQKVLVILLVDSFTPRKLLDPLLLKINLKQNETSSNMRTVIALDLYSPGNSQFISHFEDYLYQAIRDKKISVTSKGDFPIFPLSLNDLIKASIKSLFSRNTKGELFCLGGDEIKDLDLAYLIRNTLSDQGVEIYLNTTSSEKTSFCNKNDLIEAQAKLNWLPKDTFTSDFKKLSQKLIQGNTDDPKKSPYESLFSIPAQAPLKHLDQEKPFSLLIKKIKKKPKVTLEEDLTVIQTAKRGVGSIFKTFLFSFFVVLMLPVLGFILFLTLNINFLYKSYQDFRQSDIDKARNTLKLANTFHQSANFWFQILIPVSATFVPNTIKDLNNFYLLLDHASDFLTSVYDSYSLSNRYYQDLIGRTDTNNPQLLNAINLSLDSLLDNLSQIQLLTSQSKLPLGLKTKLQNPEFINQIQILKKQLNIGVSLVDLLQKISLKKDPTKILIIVQDDNELRGSGGYLNTTISLTLTNNKITDYQVEPALNIDKLIDGRVEPPKIINLALGQNNWFFRDANLSGSFPETASQVSWFFNRFKSLPVQGVLALNSSFYKSLLKDLGPITLSNGQIVAADNLPIMLASLTIDPQNDILTLLSENLFAKLKMGEIPFIPLARAFSKEIENRDVSLWFQSENLESSVPVEMSQNPGESSCHPQLHVFGCKQDFIYLNENNLSVNKLNLYLKRDQQHRVDINSSGEVSYELNYQYTYPIPAPNNLNQTYNSYYQLYLSPRVHLKSVFLDDREFPLSQVSESLTSVRKYEFYLPQTINQNHNLKISLVSNQNLFSNQGQTPFSVYFQKQPGTNDSLRFELSYPPFLTPKLLTVPLQNSSPNALSGSFKILPKEALGVLFKAAW